jgi:Na+/H+ antiporter NhaC
LQLNQEAENNVRKLIMNILWTFTPIFLFVFIFVGSGVYFSLTGYEKAFTILPPVIAILPSIILAWVRNRKTVEEKTADFLAGIGEKDIVYMCVIFLLSGAFGEVTKNIGSIESLVNCTISFVPAKFLLIGIFLISAFLSTAIGSALGTVAAVGPVAADFCLHASGISMPVAMGAVVGGAFFGDNLSLVSDTTIVSISSQGADVKKKFSINLRIAAIATLIAVIAMCLSTAITVDKVQMADFSLVLIFPYIALLVLAFSRVNILVCLTLSILLTGIIGHCCHPDYCMMKFCNDINAGFLKVYGVLLLGLMVGGLSGLIGSDAVKEVARIISERILQGKSESKIPQFIIGALASMFTFLLSNNVIAIICCGKIAKGIAKNNEISPHYSATILEVFACGVKGLLPHGTQILLASSLAGISPLSILPRVYYCHALIIVSILFILFVNKKSSIVN